MDSESTLTIDEFGTKFWRNKRGQLHRLDGPAAEHLEGTKYWFQDGKLHRLDGPAVILYNDNKEWFKYGVQYTSKESFFENLTEEEKKIALFSDDFLNG
jgi:regulation of enolase protein 1 (concanavalin A-like superfamily)